MKKRQGESEWERGEKEIEREKERELDTEVRVREGERCGVGSCVRMVAAGGSWLGVPHRWAPAVFMCLLGACY